MNIPITSFFRPFPERNGKMTFRADWCNTRPRSERFENDIFRVFLLFAFGRGNERQLSAAGS